MPAPLAGEPYSSKDRLSVLKATIYSVILTAAYVAVLYLRRSTRPSATINRDDPSVIKARITAISLVTVIAIFVYVPFVLVLEGVYNNWFMASASLRIFWGWKSRGSGLPDLVEIVLVLVWDCLKALLLTAVLFMGPIADVLYFSHQERSYTMGYGGSHATPQGLYNEMKKGLSTIYGVRNYVVGPITEEFVFRAGVIALFLASPCSKTALVYATPLLFGVAHLHHAYELYVDSSSELSPQVIAFTTLFQFTFTTIFGWYAAFLFLRMGSVWPCVAVHIFCNSLGPPSFGRVGKNMTQTFIYRAMLIVGMTAFWHLLKPLTRSVHHIL